MSNAEENKFFPDLCRITYKASKQSVYPGYNETESKG